MTHLTRDQYASIVVRDRKQRAVVSDPGGKRRRAASGKAAPTRRGSSCDVVRE